MLRSVDREAGLAVYEWSGHNSLTTRRTSSSAGLTVHQRGTSDAYGSTR